MRLSQRSIALFWAPLAATWVMMATEGPFLAAVIARLADPKFNLAAHGVAFAFAVLIEAPVLMLMSAATALVKDRVSFVRLRRFAIALNLLSTGLLLVLLIPSVYNWLMGTVIRLPKEVSDLTYGALWFYLPWPSAIGYRRFMQGVMIRAGKTRLVAAGTVIRLVVMSIMAMVGYFILDIPGAWVGGLALASAVVAEAIASRFMAAETVRELMETEPAGGGSGMGYGEIAAFYYPLALTSLIGLSIQPMLTFFMGRSVGPVESLAVFPVVSALAFFFRAMGLAFQDTAIALMGDDLVHMPELRRFALILGAVTSGGLALVAFTPLSDVWFVTISGLAPELTRVALLPAMIVVPLPALSVLLSFQRAILVERRQTRHITVASAVEVVVVAVVFATLGWGVGWMGVTAAFVSFIGGRAAANTYLLWGVRRALRSPA